VLQLMTRGEPLIDLAVATYCDQHEPLVSLWKSGDETVRAAIVRNTVRRGFTGLPTENIVELFSDDQLTAAILMNPSIPHEALANVFMCFSSTSNSLAASQTDSASAAEVR
jgi:hypothetical protein